VPGTPVTSSNRARVKACWRRVAPFVPGALLALVVGLIAAVALGSRRPGHWWGDDWALYIRQADGLRHFNPGAVARANEFTVNMSAGGAFSPGVYPWGFPFLLALAIPFVGTDVDALAIVGVLGLCAAACAWFALARPRLGWAVALVGVPAVVATPVLLGWAELIQSELPFLAFALGALALLEHLSRTGWLHDRSRHWWPLALLGLWAAFVFEIRREGLAIIPAIAVAQLVNPPRVFTDGAPLAQRLRAMWPPVRMLIPHATFAVATLAIKVGLPSVLVPQYGGNTVANTWRRFDRNIDHVLELAGLKRAPLDNPTVLGSTRWGWVIAGVWLGLAVVGIVLALSWRLRRDAHLVAYAAAAFVIGASAQGSLNRYFATVTPVLTLLAASALAAIVRLPLRRWRRMAIVVPGLVVALALGGVVVANARDARVRLRNTERILDSGQIEWGAQHPAAEDMYAAVRSLTGPDDIVASPKARAMGLFTGRPSIQVDDYRPVPAGVAIALLVAEPGTRSGQAIAADPTWQPVWRNTRFVLYEPSS